MSRDYHVYAFDGIKLTTSSHGGSSQCMRNNPGSRGWYRDHHRYKRASTLGLRRQRAHSSANSENVPGREDVVHKIKTVSLRRNYLRDAVRDAEIVHACALAKCKGCVAMPQCKNRSLMLRRLKKRHKTFKISPDLRSKVNASPFKTIGRGNWYASCQKIHEHDVIIFPTSRLTFPACSRSSRPIGFGRWARKVD